MGRSLHYANINNKRDLRLFLWYLSGRDIAILINSLSSSNSFYNEGDIFGNDVEIASGAVNQAILLIKDKAIKRIYTKEFDYFKALQLPPGEFSWIKKSPDSCYFAWLYLKAQVHDLNGELHLIPEISGKIRNDNYSITGHDFLYKRTQINPYPVDNKERLIAIQDFFDRAPSTLRAKLNLMHRIRNRWNELYYLSAHFPLSPKEKKKCDWAWDYIQKDRSRMSCKRKTVDNTYSDCLNTPSSTDSVMLSELRPSGTYEKYMAVKFSYIFRFVKDDLFVQRFKKAWEVRKYRISADTKKKSLRRSEKDNKKGVSKPVSAGSDLVDFKSLPAENNDRQFSADLIPFAQNEPGKDDGSKPVKIFQHNKGEDFESVSSTHSVNSQTNVNPLSKEMKYSQIPYLKYTFPFPILNAAHEGLSMILQKGMKIRDKKKNK